MPDAGGRHKRLKDVAGDPRAMVHEFDGLTGLDEVVLSQITDPRRSEMVTRWDMIATPPDILVTNYSMLNVMLMREFEEPVFEQTPGLAEAGRQHTCSPWSSTSFTSTAARKGAEVALIVRSLLRPTRPGARLAAAALHRHQRLARRLGLRVPRAVLRSSGRVLRPDPGAAADSERHHCPSTQSAVRRELRERGFVEGIDRALVAACRDEATGAVRAFPLSTIGERLFGEGNHADCWPKFLGAMSALPQESQIPFRAHLFLRTMRGLWACSDPDCNEVERAAPQRTSSGGSTRSRCSSARVGEGFLRRSTATSAATSASAVLSWGRWRDSPSWRRALQRERGSIFRSSSGDQQPSTAGTGLVYLSHANDGSMPVRTTQS